MVSLISEEEISSLVELFCNQFYENILIPNQEQKELLLLVYKLLEREKSPMNSASIDEFLNNKTFLGKFISSFLKSQEYKFFLTNLLNPFIRDIENNNSDNYIDNEYCDKEEEEDEEDEDFESEEENLEEIVENRRQIK